MQRATINALFPRAWKSFLEEVGGVTINSDEKDGSDHSLIQQPDVCAL